MRQRLDLPNGQKPNNHGTDCVHSDSANALTLDRARTPKLLVPRSQPL